MQRDGFNKSIWQDTQLKQQKENLAHGETDKIYDAIIVGAGITGITTAYNLAKTGKKVLIIEAQNPGFGTTGGTTAHLNNFFDTSYDEVIKNFGLDEAKLLAAGGKESIEIIKQNAETNQIDCAFKDRTAYLFSVDKEQSEMLEDITAASNKVGVPMQYINDSPFPIPYLKIVQIQNNAQFNPAFYIYGLLEAFKHLGGEILENCRVTGVDGNEVLEVETSRGKINCYNLVYATHIPPGVNQLHFENQAYRSYAIAVRLKDGNYPEALGYDLCEPYHYYRSQELNGQQYLIAGGEDHKTGDAINTEQCFRKLESYVTQFFDIEQVAYKWSSQYYVPADGLPYIGKKTAANKNIFVATGYNGNGMMFGTLAGQIICDLICERENKFQKLFDPLRIRPLAGFSEIMKNAADTVGNLLGIKVAKEKIDVLASLAADEGKLVKYDGKTMGIYKDEQHNIHMVNPACTHIHCTVAWNSTEKSWDCPCHGARYNADGAMLTGPARKDLENLSD